MTTTTNDQPTEKLSDPSGRGKVDGYRIIFPQRQHDYTEEEIASVVNVMRNAEGQTQGAYLEQFEADFAQFIGADHAFGVSNCTNALKLAGIFANVGPGDEVIVPAYTYCASAIPFADLGATIVWADIDPNVDGRPGGHPPRSAPPKAIVAVHLLGIPGEGDYAIARARHQGRRGLRPGLTHDRQAACRHVRRLRASASRPTMTTLGEGVFIVRTHRSRRPCGRAPQRTHGVPGPRDSGLR